MKKTVIFLLSIALIMNYVTLAAQPSAPTDFSATPIGISLACHLSWINPATTITGDPLNSITKIVIERNDEIIKEIENPTVGTPMNFIGCGKLTIQNVKVLYTSIVNISAPEEIIINPDFHAALGTNVWIRIKEPDNRTPSNSITTKNTTTPIDYTLQSLSVNNLDFSIYPNPNSGVFNIEANFPLSDIANLKITNMLGVPVYETQNLTSTAIQLQTSSTGIFFVVMILKDGSVLTQKMMVQ